MRLHGAKNGDVSHRKDASTVDKELMPPPPSQGSSALSQDENDLDKRDKRLETPLGAMLPSKYADVDVTEIFPDFRQDKVLRFSRLFGYGKFSSLPQIWRSVRRKKKKKEREQKTTTQSESASDSDEPRKCNGFNARFAPIPPKDEIISDDEERLLSDKKPEENDHQSDDASANNAKKEAAEWRFGPAKLW